MAKTATTDLPRGRRAARPPRILAAALLALLVFSLLLTVLFTALLARTERGAIPSLLTASAQPRAVTAGLFAAGGEPVSLPYSLDVGQGGGAVLYCLLPAALPQDPYLLLPCGECALTVLSGDAVVYEHTAQMSDIYAMVPLAGRAGERLTFVFSSSRGVSLTLEKVELGGKAELLWQLFRQNLPRLLIALFGALIGVASFALGLVFAFRALDETAHAVLCFGLFMLMLSAWSFTGNALLSLLLPAQYSELVVVNALLLHLLGIPFLQFVRFITGAMRRAADGLSALFLLWTAAAFALEWSGALSLQRSAPVLYALLAAAALTGIAACTKAFLAGRRRMLFAFLSMMALLFGLVACAVCWWVGGAALRTGVNLLQWCIVAFIGFASFLVCNVLLDRFSQLGELDVYRRLAYLDPLTRIGNRSAMDRFAEQQTAAHGEGGSIAAVCLDADRLKQVNDRLGHIAGDRYLFAIARAASDAFEGVGRAFRTGGDEFTVLCFDVGEQKLRQAVARFEQLIAENADITAYGGSVSVGFALRELPADLTDLLRAADLDMYAAKERGRAARAPAQDSEELLRELAAPYETAYTVDLTTGICCFFEKPQDNNGLVLPDRIPLSELTELFCRVCARPADRDGFLARMNCAALAEAAKHGASRFRLLRRYGPDDWEWSEWTISPLADNPEKVLVREMNVDAQVSRRGEADNAERDLQVMLSVCPSADCVLLADLSDDSVEIIRLRDLAAPQGLGYTGLLRYLEATFVPGGCPAELQQLYDLEGLRQLFDRQSLLELPDIVSAAGVRYRCVARRFDDYTDGRPLITVVFQTVTERRQLAGAAPSGPLAQN